MKFLNNVSIRAKLLIISVPLALALIFSAVFLGVQINSTEEEVSKLYYDILYNANNSLINADRDFYQAVLAATLFIMTPAGTVRPIRPSSKDIRTTLRATPLRYWKG